MISINLPLADHGPAGFPAVIWRLLASIYAGVWLHSISDLRERGQAIELLACIAERVVRLADRCTYCYNVIHEPEPHGGVITLLTNARACGHLNHDTG